MKSLMKFAAAAAMVFSLSFNATGVSAAEARQPSAAPPASLTGGIAATEPKMIAKAPVQEKIVVARRGRWIGPAIVGGVVAGALIAGAANARASDRGGAYYDDRHYDRGPSQCERLYYKCNDGQDWACRKYYRQCD